MKAMLPLFALKAGCWYIMIRCPNCKALLPILRDLTEGTGTLKGIYSLECPKCNHKAEGEPERYYHPVESSEAFGGPPVQV
jgi:hypothetical protein